MQSSQTDASQRDVASRSQHNSQENATTILPQQLLDQLSSILQQAQNLTFGSAHTEVDAIEDNRLSAASLPVRPTSEQIRTSTQTGVVDGLNRTTVQPLPLSLPQPALPSIPSRIKEKIAKGEYIDFTTSFTQSHVFGAQEPQSQTLTLQLNPSGDNFSMQPPTTTKKITSFGTWMEA